jgi:hypothetical protein
VLTGVIEWSLTNRALVIALFVLMALGGLYAATQIPVDAVPDLVNVQVQVVTEAGTLPPLEVERLITYPVELAMSGLPDVEELRSISRLGISLVTIVFREHTDIMLARQLVAERLPAARGGAYAAAAGAIIALLGAAARIVDHQQGHLCLEPAVCAGLHQGFKVAAGSRSHHPQPQDWLGPGPIRLQFRWQWPLDAGLLIARV